MTLAAYLAENFPEKSKPQGAIVAGPAQVTFKEWTLPTPGSRPHDPLATLDGTIWYTGQMANVLGRIDPTTGRINEYHLDTPMSGPHGLVADQTATSGSPPILPATSASSTPARGKSPNTNCRTRPRAIRTRRSSIKAASCGSPCKAAT